MQKTIDHDIAHAEVIFSISEEYVTNLKIWAQRDDFIEKSTI